MAKLKNAPVALIIMDGFGDGDPNDLKYNAIAMAKTPVLDGLMKEFQHTEIQASGEYVGLPDGQMGNSEVGHTNIGAGRIVYQQLTRITRDIKNGDFFKNKALLTIVRGVKEHGGALHVMGLVSPGGVHSHDDHLFAVLELAKREGLTEVWIHAFLDGRDVPPKSAQEYLEAVEKKAAEIGVGKIATVSGRYYAMDRDKRWERVEKAYDAIAKGEGVKRATAKEAIEASYAEDVTDEFVIPAVIGSYAGMKKGDGVIFFNFRPDRARELTHAFTDKEMLEDASPSYVTLGTGAFMKRRSCLSAREHQEHARLDHRAAWHDAAPHRRDGKVRARHLFLQRRRGRAVQGRGSHPRSFAEGRDV